MPFTFAHPAVVLALVGKRARWFSATGLIVGSVIPDFEYFLRLELRSIHSHKLTGLFYWDLPVAIVLCFIFHLVVKRPLIRNLPSLIGQRFNEVYAIDWSQHFKKFPIQILASILVGAGSHILWDSFTHYHGFFVSSIPALRQELLGVAAYRIIQHSSTIIGFTFIIWYIIKMPKKNTLPEGRISYWGLVLVTTVIGLAFFFPENFQIGNVIVVAISSFLSSLFLAGVIFRVPKQSA